MGLALLGVELLPGTGELEGASDGLTEAVEGARVEEGEGVDGASEEVLAVAGVPAVGEFVRGVAGVPAVPDEGEGRVLGDVDPGLAEGLAAVAGVETLAGDVPGDAVDDPGTGVSVLPPAVEELLGVPGSGELVGPIVGVEDGAAAGLVEGEDGLGEGGAVGLALGEDDAWVLTGVAVPALGDGTDVEDDTGELEDGAGDGLAEGEDWLGVGDAVGLAVGEDDAWVLTGVPVPAVEDGTDVADVAGDGEALVTGLPVEALATGVEDWLGTVDAVAVEGAADEE